MPTTAARSSRFPVSASTRAPFMRAGRHTNYFRLTRSPESTEDTSVPWHPKTFHPSSSTSPRSPFGFRRTGRRRDSPSARPGLRIRCVDLPGHGAIAWVTRGGFSGRIGQEDHGRAHPIFDLLDLLAVALALRGEPRGAGSAPRELLPLTHAQSAQEVPAKQPVLQRLNWQTRRGPGG